MKIVQEEERIGRLKQLARGRWKEVLVALNVPPVVVNGKVQPCRLPGCMGAGRFQYLDSCGDGEYICSACGPGGGLKLLRAFNGKSMSRVLRELEVYLEGEGEAAAAPVPERSRDQRIIAQLLAQSVPVAPGDEVDRYFGSRGVSMAEYPAALRKHEALPFYEVNPETKERQMLLCTPALLSLVSGPDPSPPRLHRLYLQNGAPALGQKSAKMLGELGGGSVHLATPDDTVCVTEDLPSGLAVLMRTGQPVWCALTSENMMRLWLPERIKTVRIYARNSADYSAERAAYHLAHRSTQYRRKVEVYIPRQAGGTWAEVWSRRAQHLSRVA